MKPTSFQVSNVSSTKKDETSDWQQGYGYQFWRCRHDLYRADGAVGQYCIVMPAQDAVVAITSETADMQAIMNQVWTHLLPGMKNAPLAPNEKSQTALKQKLASLTLLPTKTLTTSPLTASISGKAYQLNENPLNAETLSFLFEKETCTFTLTGKSGKHQIVCGLGQWIKDETMMPGTPPKLVASGQNEQLNLRWLPLVPGKTRILS